MSDKSVVYIRIDTNLKEIAEGKQLDAELMKGIRSLGYGRTYTVDEVDDELFREFGI